MSIWSSGYNTDLGYTFGYYREQSPEWLNFVAWAKAVTAPAGAWRYLELGCGQGYGLVLMAGLNPDHEFLGIDFNPVHIAHAQALAHAAGLTNIRFEEADFVALGQDWPAAWGKFDYITAHGIYSWLDHQVCQGIVQTLDHAAAAGALVYISYNTLPGWVSSYPVQHLMRLWQTTESIPSVKAIETGLQRLGAIAEAESGMTRSLPGMKDMIEKVGTRDRAYLVQEYLHDNWHPRWFDQVVTELTPAKLSYVGTASLGDLYLQSFLPPKYKAVLEPYGDPVVREVMVDVLTNQSFRRDVFSRGASPMWTLRRQETVLQQKYVLLGRPPKSTEIKFKTSVGELTGKSEIYEAFFDKLETGPKSAGELMELDLPKPLNLNDILQALSFMLNAGYIGFYCPPVDPQPALALNREIAIAVAEGAPYRFVIGSQVGTVLTVSDVDLMFLAKLITQGDLAAPQLGNALTDCLLSLGKGLVKDGKPCTIREELLPYTQELAKGFLEQTLPLWKRMGVCN
jgi:SAM-dependent methyltransferase